MELAKKLNGLRLERGYTLRGIQSRTGVSNAYLSQLENGHVRNPSVFVIVALCKLYEVSIDSFMEGIVE